MGDPNTDGSGGGAHEQRMPWQLTPDPRQPYLQMVSDRRDEIRHGPKTMLVLDGLPASGRTTLTRHIARTYRMVPVDADAARRGIAVAGIWFCSQYHEPRCWHETPERSERWAHNVSAASLVSQLFAVEIMDQGRDTVVCGLVDVYADSEPASGWAADTRRLIDPHRMFGVLLTVEEPVRQDRLAQRGPGWSTDADTAVQGRPGWADLEVDTSTCSVEDAAATIMSGLRDAAPPTAKQGDTP